MAVRQRRGGVSEYSEASAAAARGTLVRAAAVRAVRRADAAGHDVRLVGDQSEERRGLVGGCVGREDAQSDTATPRTDESSKAMYKSYCSLTDVGANERVLLFIVVTGGGSLSMPWVSVAGRTLDVMFSEIDGL